MKIVLSILMMLAAVAVARPVHAQQKAKWLELDSFHEVMAQTFHPSEEGKLEPIRSRSAEMLEKAIAWKNSTAPEGYDQNAVRTDLKDLVKGAKEINKMVQDKADDASLKEKLSKLHDSFHQIVEKCGKEEHM
jgi:hypothetical protein